MHIGVFTRERDKHWHAVNALVDRQVYYTLWLETGLVFHDIWKKKWNKLLLKHKQICLNTYWEIKRSTWKSTEKVTYCLHWTVISAWSQSVNKKIYIFLYFWLKSFTEEVNKMKKLLWNTNFISKVHLLWTFLYCLRHHFHPEMLKLLDWSFIGNSHHIFLS